MTREEKQLLLKDLCARLPYGFVVHRYSDNCDITFERNELDQFAHFLEYSEGEIFKPYLRPLSSMTDEERGISEQIYKDGGFWAHFDWLNENHFDYRIDPSTGKTLITSNLALEAPEGMYKTS